MADALRQARRPRPVIDLSSNENPLGPSPLVAAAIQAELAGLHRYPSRDGTKLRNLLSEQLNVRSDQLLLGNGVCELLDIAARALLSPGTEALVPVPTFMPYGKVVQRCGAQLVPVAMKNGEHDLDAMLAAVTANTRLILIGNPNNPTGSIIRRPQLEQFLAALRPDVLVVMDEAYVEYVDDPEYPDCIDLVRSGANILVLRTLSKAYGLAGLRIGYGIANPELINRLDAGCQFYNTNSLAQAAAVAALQDQAHLRRTQQLNRNGLNYLSSALMQLGLKVRPSHANFLLVDVGAADLVIELLAEEGILVKPMERFGLPHCLRVSSGLERDNQQFIKTLSSILNARPECRITPY